MMHHLKRLSVIVLFLGMTGLLFGQGSTTSAMSGRILDDGGQPLPVATVVATHVPSGTQYGVVTNEDGYFNIQGMRPGGPYTVGVSFVGYSKKSFTDINLSLGQTFILNTKLTLSSSQLGEVVIIGERPSAFRTEKNGASTNITRQEMNMIPSLNRSLSDYVKLSPYSTGGNSFVGRESYNSNITVDGANFNNNFGLSSAGMPGVSGEPISMEAIEEIQIAIAPFDVRQSNFTGASVNAITKSGTNEFRASVYGFYRDQSFNGTKIRDKVLSVSQSSKKAYGFNVAGPIIKNKLFFFISAEKENTLTPGNTLLAMEPGRDPADLNVNSTVSADSLKRFSQVLNDKFGYSTGKYESWGGDNEYNNKILAKLDWNINDKNRLTVRYNYSESSARSALSNSGDARPTISGSRQSRTGGLSYENSMYYRSNKLHSITGELNSRFGGFSNKLLAAYTSSKEPRTTDSSVFPFIDIMTGDPNKGLPQMSAGYELFSYKNNVDNNTLIVTDNVTYQLDRNNFTFGLSFESQTFGNSYLRQGTGYYRFKDLGSFENYVNGVGDGKPWNANYDPINFAYTYPINGLTDPVAKLSFGQFATYLQDEFSATENLKLTAGLRIDVPMYFSGAVDNPGLKGVTFRDGETVDLSTWPTTKLMWSPRLGFSWDVFGDNKLKVRGGTGIFTGRIPFVWFTNQPSNSGMLQYQLVINQSGGQASKDLLARLPFLANAADLLKDAALADIFPQSNPVGGRIAAISKEFKLPQVWRTSLAFDIKLPANMLLTLEGVYTKDINAIYFDNINLQPAADSLVEGSNIRPYWSNNTTATKYITKPFTDVVVMKNTNMGQGYAVSARLDLPRVAGFSGMLAYARTWGEEVTGKSGSDPFSAWQYRVLLNNLNSQELGYTANNTPHRITAGLNYSVEYLKVLKSTISLFYLGRTGDAYSLIYSGDANGDGTSNHELMYIPSNGTDLLWASQADQDAYFAFASQDPYLSKHAGEYAKRFGAYNPWNQRLDVRFAQDIKVRAGKNMNTIQISIDKINAMNLLNSSWGLNQTYVYNTPLEYVGRDAVTNQLKVKMRKINNEYPTTSFQDPTSVAGTWGIQIGVRYLFN